jgi:dTDP-4-amino-4,6-dideoxygalactose transaminase
MQVPFYDGRKSFEELWPDLQARLDALIQRGKYSHGMMVAELEKAIQRFTGARYAFGCNNGTDALILLLRAAGVGPGDEVIVPCFTFFATASSVAHALARPVFVDVDPVSYTMSPEAVRRAVTPRTKAIMPVHLFCQMADMTALKQVSEATGVAILEDSAEAIGMWYGGTHAGLHGRGGVLSFFPTKTLGALGDAGMILTNEPAVAELANVLRHHGRVGGTIDNMPGISNPARVSGTNSKMDDIQAAVLLTRLGRLEADVARRAALARRYDERLAALGDHVTRPRVAQRAEPTNAVFYVYLIEAERKSELVAYLKQHGVETEEYYPFPLHLQPCFAELGYRPGDFPVAERACARTVALPLYPDLTNEAVDHVCDTIADFYANARGPR